MITAATAQASVIGDVSAAVGDQPWAMPSRTAPDAPPRAGLLKKWTRS